MPILSWKAQDIVEIIQKFPRLDKMSNKDTFNVYDLKNRLVDHGMVVGEVSHMLCKWGNIILIMARASKQMMQPLLKFCTNMVIMYMGNKIMMRLCFSIFSLLDILNLHMSSRNFLDAQRIYNLTNYLEKLHERGLASKDITTLLLNCYTKLKEVEKLKKFIKGEVGVGEHKFDVETAIRVCRIIGYHEALQYILTIEPNQAGVIIKEYGKILVEHMPVETIEILVNLCTGTSKSAKRATSNGNYLSMLPSPMDFINIFVHSPKSLGYGYDVDLKREMANGLTPQSKEKIVLSSPM